MFKNKRGLKIEYLPWIYSLSSERRIVDETNQPLEGKTIKNQQYVWHKIWGGLVHKDFINENNMYC